MSAQIVHEKGGWYVRYMDDAEDYGSVQGPWTRELLPVPADASREEAMAAFSDWLVRHDG